MHLSCRRLILRGSLCLLSIIIYILCLGQHCQTADSLIMQAEKYELQLLYSGFDTLTVHHTRFKEVRAEAYYRAVNKKVFKVVRTGWIFGWDELRGAAPEDLDVEVYYIFDTSLIRFAKFSFKDKKLNSEEVLCHFTETNNRIDLPYLLGNSSYFIDCFKKQRFGKQNIGTKN